jgi:hypothetical protein
LFVPQVFNDLGMSGDQIGALLIIFLKGFDLPFQEFEDHDRRIF